MIIVLFFLIVFKLSQISVVAEETFSFSYMNILPDNQIKETKGNSFDLLVKEGQNQVLESQIKNETNQEITVGISINDATTSSSGTINYGPSKDKLLSEANPKLTDILKAPTQVTLKPKETQTIKLELKVPETSFQGIILGGIHLKELQPKEKKQETTGIDNEYAYVYSVRLRETENEKKAKPVFENRKSYIDKDNIYISFVNKTPEVIKNITVEMGLYQKKSDKILSEKKVKNYKMAPYSIINIPFEMPEIAKDNETKRTKTKIIVEDQEWLFENELEQIKEVKNQEDLEIKREKIKTLNLLIVGLLLISFIGFVFLIYWFIRRKTKKRKKH